MAGFNATLVAIVLFGVGLVPCAAASGQDKKCGCSWTRSGCGISTDQLINGLAYSPVNQMCTARSKKDLTTDSWADRECRARYKVFDVLPDFQLCKDYDASKCSREKQCQWGAQAIGQCGIDEEELLVRVLQRNYKSLEHPLVRMIRKHDECSKLSEHTCEANHKCEWQELPGGARHCDLNLASMYGTLLENPSILVLLDTIVASSRCRAKYEHGDPPTCTGQCELHEGICMLGSDSLLYPRYPPGAMVDAICAAEVSHHICPDPCIRNESTYSCHAPPELPRSFREPRLTETDWNVIEVFYAISSATMVYEAQCSVLASEASCGEATGTCSVSPEWGSSEGQTTDDPVAPGPGLNGALGRFADALESGTAARDFEEYLQQNPDDVTELVAGLSRGFKKFYAEDKLRPTERPTKPPVVKQGVKDHGPSVPDLTPMLPVLFVALVVFAICGGIATGSFCHAGFSQWGFEAPRSRASQGSRRMPIEGSRNRSHWERAAFVQE